jgi:flagellar biosynthesis/type III secretory pathway ATPase
MSATQSAIEAINLDSYLARLDKIDPFVWSGKVVELVGLLIESRGPAAAIGDFCEIQTSSGRVIRTQVIGFRNGTVSSMALVEIDGLK